MLYGECFHVTKLICVYLMWMTTEDAGRPSVGVNVEWCDL